LALVVAVDFGVNYTKWREKNLKSHGFEYLGSKIALSPEGAIALWVKAKQQAETT
jgi:hypothetical protein